MEKKQDWSKDIEHLNPGHSGQNKNKQTKAFFIDCQHFNENPFFVDINVDIVVVVIVAVVVVDVVAVVVVIVHVSVIGLTDSVSEDRCDVQGFWSKQDKIYRSSIQNQDQDFW